MRALITGATGFLGGALAYRLLELGWEVTASGRNEEIGEQLQEDGMRFVQADLRQEDEIRAACAGQDVVFHCAAAVGTWGDYKEFYAINVSGTRHVVDGCKEHGVQRLVHVSTPSIYLSKGDRFNVKEDDRLPRRPANVYAATKLLAEGVIDQAHADGLPVVTIRPRSIFGPNDGTLFARLLTAIKAGQMRVLGDGKNVQDLSYIDNVVDALLLCAEAPPQALGQKYNISNGEPVAIWEIVERLCEQLGYTFPQQRVNLTVPLLSATVIETIYRLFSIKSEPPITRYALNLLARSMTLDISAARRDLGYEPKVSVEEGMKEFLEWWKEQELIEEE